MICQMQKKVKGFGNLLSAEKGHNREEEWLKDLKKLFGERRKSSRKRDH